MLLAAGYFSLLLLYRFRIKTAGDVIPENEKPVTKFSIIIPARNEATTIGNCINSIFKNSYPTEFFEILVIDDFSTDSTAAVVTSLQSNYPSVRLIQLKDYVASKINSYKKKAIETGIQLSKFDFILTTDADCEVSENWLSAYNDLLKKENPVFIAAPVKIKYTGTFLSLFQTLDFLSLQGVTMAAVGAGLHSLCNGANLGYAKNAFFMVKGFEGVDKIASGDDMLLMHKITEKFPGKTAYLLSEKAIVETLPMENWKGFFNQRIRWASKAEYYQDKRLFPILLLVYLFNFSLLILPVIGIWMPEILIWWIGFLLGKTLMELIFLWPVAGFFHCRKLLFWFPFLQPLHIVYTLIAGFLGKFGTFEWKGRQVN